MRTMLRAPAVMAFALALALALVPATAARAAAVGACPATAVTVTVTGAGAPDTVVAGATDVVVDGTPVTCVGGNPTSILITGDGAANQVSFTGSEAYPVTANLGAGGDTFTATGTQLLTIHGDAGNDILSAGTGTGDQIFGDADDDTIRGGAGDGMDIVDGGTGIDTLTYGGEASVTGVTIRLGDLVAAGTDDAEGFENAVGSEGGDAIFGSGAVNAINGAGGNDEIHPGATDGVDIVDGAAGTDTISYALEASGGVTIRLGDGVAIGTDDAESFENAVGSEGGDTIFGSPGANEINAAGGNDTVRAGANDASDIVVGGAGSDTLSYTGEASVGGVTIRLGDGVDPGTDDAEAFENAVGSEGGDTIFGTNGSVNTINGAGGNDEIHPTATDGSDTVDGGPGSDTISYAGEVSGGVTIRLGDGVTPGSDDAEGFENAVGSQGADTIFGSGAVNVIGAAGGDDEVHPGASDLPDDVDGGAGTDTISYAGEASLGVTVRLGDLVAAGTDDAEGFEYAVGSEGGDTIFGSGAVNQIDGAGGGDTIAGAGGDDVINGGAGVDTIDGGAGADAIHGDAGDDVLTGGADPGDQVFGDGDDDTIHPGANDGLDVVDGGPGTDTISYAGEASPGVTIHLGDGVPVGGDDAESFENAAGSEGGDTIAGSPTANTITGGGAGDVIDGGSGVDTIDGEAGADTIHGDAGDDILTGGADAGDQVFGDADDDTIRGGANDGLDIVDGGPGSDTLTYAGEASPGGVTIRLGDGVDLGTDDAEGFEKAIGSQGGDTIFGSGAVNVADGAGGDDTIHPGANDGLDVVDGGAGTDTISYAGEASPGVTIHLGDGVPVGGDDAEGFEDAVGSEGGDTIFGSGAVNQHRRWRWQRHDHRCRWRRRDQWRGGGRHDRWSGRGGHDPR